MKQQKWDCENISDQKGKVVIVTGSSSGLGYETAKVLATKNATVIVAVRNEVKGNTAVEKIKVENPNADIQVVLVDLANLESIHKFAENFNKKFEKLDLLINNVGVMTHVIEYNFLPSAEHIQGPLLIDTGETCQLRHVLVRHVFDVLVN